MVLELEFLGTGDARRVPVYGCQCPACERARLNPRLCRRACSALIRGDGYQFMLDAGRTDLCESFAPGSFQAIVLTHYHMDHVMGLFHLRWGTGHTVPIYGPDDPAGCDDLYKHPGILKFQPPLVPFEELSIGPFTLTPLPLNHSKPTLGYGIEYQGTHFAYLTDTVGLPESTLDWLKRRPLALMVLDCSVPPKPNPPRNHNDLNLALALAEQVAPKRTLLTHLGHQLDEYLHSAPELPAGVEVAFDGMVARF
ncbi:MAG: phosphonate metabolism protein PhnP [Pseudomonadota bacterium]|nr:phosphonate metabolism protein PhnP [Pseudomonadota bacterium]